MRKHEGSEGWRVAHVREVMRGCAGEVMGEIADRDLGRVVVLFGKRIGEMKGLEFVSEEGDEDERENTGNSVLQFQQVDLRFRRYLAMEELLGSPLVESGYTVVSISR